jgi:Rps23 Pro-64 3,4-dihydroxylase Tpa1-like proline 4-hydroxylase
VFKLNDQLDLAALRERYERTSRVHVADFLEPSAAERLHAALANSRDWAFVFNRGNRHFELTAENAARMPREAHQQMQQEILTNARDGFQLAYEVLNVSKKQGAPLTSDPVLRDLHAFMNGPDFLDFMRELTGEDRASWCDVTATRYRPGHFCEEHDDKADDGERLAAFVLNVTPRWRADWGGLLLFVDDAGHIREGFTPAFNAINVFKAPQQHSVSAVAPFAGGQRLSVTGWLRP